MTLSAFSPTCFGPYHYTNAPKMIHFQYDGSELVHRYILVEVIPVGDMNIHTKRKIGEGLLSDKHIIEKYINGPKEERKNEVAGEHGKD